MFEDNDEIVLSRRGDQLLLSVRLTSAPPSDALLQCWMRLGAASLSHFQGALAQASASGALWLVQSLQTAPGESYLLSAIEHLLNQRDTWRSVVVRLKKACPSPPPTSLRSLLY
nr:CesT family type III secretion system chaperone [Pseudomonas sp. MWU15-20650]